jgi:hypothetical protein
MAKSQQKYNYQPSTPGREIEVYYRRGVWRSDEERQSIAKRRAYEWYAERKGIVGELDQEQREAAERWLEHLEDDIDTHRPFAPQIEQRRAEDKERREREREQREQRALDEARNKELPDPFEGWDISDGHGGISEQKYFVMLEGIAAGRRPPARRSRAEVHADAEAKPERKSKLTGEDLAMVRQWHSEGDSLRKMTSRLADRGVKISPQGLAKILKTDD